MTVYAMLISLLLRVLVEIETYLPNLEWDKKPLIECIDKYQQLQKQEIENGRQNMR